MEKTKEYNVLIALNVQQTIQLKNTAYRLIVFYSVRVGRKEFAEEKVFSLLFIFYICGGPANIHAPVYFLAIRWGKYKESEKTCVSRH